MAHAPGNPGPSGDVYPSDQDESMDTDSEADGQLTDSRGNGDFDPDVDSSINMEISDNEEPSEDRHSLPGDLSLTTSSMPEPGKARDHSSGIINGQKQEAESINDVTKDPRPLIRRESIRVPALDSIRDLEQPVYGLNIPIWQNILSFIPPLSLGKVLRTSRVFRALLAPADIPELSLRRRFHQDPRFLGPEVIWRTSRARLDVGIPPALTNKSELDMWRLICGRKCQICNTTKPVINAQGIMDPWRAGPGDQALRRLWLCAVLICGSCLSERCQQEISLQLSNTFPSFLIKALPPLFLTQNNDWVSQSTLLSQSSPPGVQIQKFYYQPHADLILRQFEEIKKRAETVTGEATAGEWLKELDNQCRKHISDAEHWERWEQNGGLRRLTAQQSPSPPTHVFAPVAVQSPPVYSQPNGPLFPAPPQYVDQHMVYYHPPGPPSMPAMPPNPPISFHGYPPAPYGNFPAHPPPLTQQVVQGKPRRSLQEVNEARAARRQEIERRCLLLEPPITAKVLTHMQSFQAALQISFPFTDKDWEFLKPRLLAQREAAEAQETVLAEELKVIQATTAQPSLEVLLMKPPHEMSESEWEQLQSPLRDALSKHADQYIDNAWEGGSRVNQDTVTQFAPDVLLTVRNKYYESFNQETHVGGGRPAPRIPLSLESMKWLYDSKVKGVAESYQKELFQCGACDLTSRFYGFEGVVQHFAAKHTTALSLGNIIVNWRTEWPEMSPFNQIPGSSNNAWNGSAAGNVHPMSAVNPGDYGQSLQMAPYGQQAAPSAGPQYFGHFQHAPTFYDQPEGNNYHQSTGGHSTGSQAFPQHATYGNNPVPDQGYQNPSLPYLQPSAASELHRKQLTEMAAYSRELFNATMGIKELSASVRVYVLLHHMFIKFGKKFGASPELSMFLHGLNENAQMRPIRSLNGLSCKACGIVGRHSATERKSFTLPALVNHFKNAHLVPGSAASDLVELDWKTDMIELPDSSVIENLVDSNGLDDRKFHLIAEAFPDAFPTPLPGLSAIKETRAKAKAAAIRLENLRALSFPLTNSTSQQQLQQPQQQQQQQLAVREGPSRIDSSRTSQDRFLSKSPFQSDRGSIEPAREDEYDPSRNTFIGNIVEHSGLPRAKRLHEPVDVILPPGIVSLGVVDDHGQPESPYSQGGYADRLLRHHRGLQGRRSSYIPEGRYQEYSAANDSSSISAAKRFLDDLSPTVSQQDPHAVYSTVYSPIEDVERRRTDHPVQISSRAVRHTYSPPRYVENHLDYGTSITGPESWTDGKSYAVQATQYEQSIAERRRNELPGHTARVASQSYQGRDRSRSPRRSAQQEHTSYDPNIPGMSYEGRQEVRWRGESPPRNGYHRGQQGIAQPTRAGDSFVGRDAQGRSVRYVAVPVDEYESHLAVYPPARAAPVAEPVSYLTRSSDMMEVGPDGRLYLVNSRAPVRYERNSLDETYRDYR